MDWMKAFYSQCPDCLSSTDILALHWYDVHESDLEAYIENWYSTFQKPIVVSEFACQVRILPFEIICWGR